MYRSRIIKASALITDTEVLLNTWDVDSPVAETLDRAAQRVMTMLRDFGVLQGIDNETWRRPTCRYRHPERGLQ